MKRFTLQLALAVAAGALSLSASTIQVTLPEFNGVDIRTGFPLAAVTIGTFNYTIPVGEQIVSATFSSTFGDSSVANSAGVDVFVGGIKVGSCAELASCDTADVVTPFSYSFLASNFSTLKSGSLNVTAVQQGGNIIRLGVETLTINSAATNATPEPASVALIGMGLGGLALLGRRRIGKI